MSEDRSPRREPGDSSDPETDDRDPGTTAALTRRRFLLAGLVGAGGVTAGLVTRRSDDPPGDPTRDAGVRTGSARDPARDVPLELRHPHRPDDSVLTARDAQPPAPPRGVHAEIICRDAWGASPAAGEMRGHEIGAVMLHHTATRLDANHVAPDRLRHHQRYHQRRAGWADIAYHVGVDLNGNIYELRDPAYAGDTFTGYEPAGHLLIVAEGNYDAQHPSDRLLQGVAEAIAWGAESFGAAPSTLTGHRDHVPSTACPGDHLYARQDAIRREAERLIADGGVAISVLCGEGGRRRVEDIETGRS